MPTLASLILFGLEVNTRPHYTCSRSHFFLVMIANKLNVLHLHFLCFRMGPSEMTWLWSLLLQVSGTISKTTTTRNHSLTPSITGPIRTFIQTETSLIGPTTWMRLRGSFLWTMPSWTRMTRSTTTQWTDTTSGPWDDVVNVEMLSASLVSRLGLTLSTGGEMSVTIMRVTTVSLLQILQFYSDECKIHS